DIRVRPKDLFLLCGGLCSGAAPVFAAETLHAAGRIHQLLLAGKERMAARADFYVDVALVGGTGGESTAAGAMHAHFVVRGMNGCLHGFSKSCSELFDSKGSSQDSANGRRWSSAVGRWQNHVKSFLAFPCDLC